MRSKEEGGGERAKEGERGRERAGRTMGKSGYVIRTPTSSSYGCRLVLGSRMSGGADI